MSDVSDALARKEGFGARVTLRLSERDTTAQRAELERLSAALSAARRRESDRVIERHEHTMRALIEALNVHLMAKSGAGRR